MSIRSVVSQLGLLHVVLGIVMLVVAAVFWIIPHDAVGRVDDRALFALLASGGLGVFAGGLVWLLTRERQPQISRKSAFVLVVLSWTVGSALAALPFWLWAHWAADGDQPFQSFVNCYFESVSGFTTAGSSILTDIAAVPASLLFWRATIQWLGGIGIVVLFVAVFPNLGVGAKKLFTLEVSGPTKGQVLPTIRSSARTLLGIYILLTALQVLALLLAGMNLFDAVAHAFTTLATGGYSPKNASVGEYDSTSIDIVITVFMLLGGVNFGLYYLLLQREFKSVWRDTELRVYLGLFLIASLIIAVLITGSEVTRSTGAADEVGFFGALRYATFNIASVQTTTGYATADYDQWPALACAIMFILILFGGSAGSTSGGLKVLRIIIVFRVLYTLIERAFRPQVIRTIRVKRQPIDEQTQLMTFGFIIGTIAILGFGTIALMCFEPSGQIDLKTAASANVATFCTTGPGFGKVGPVQNFGWLSDASKMTLCAVMILGRLEIMAVVAILTPKFWRQD